MSRRHIGPISPARIAIQGSKAAFQNVTGHPMLALFSLVAAFGIWVAVQDVDNPRVIEGSLPEAGIPVEAVNVPEGYLVEDLPVVRVRVEARRSVIEDLEPDDFEAKVDVRRTSSGSTEALQPVKVTSKRSGVRVVEQPPPIEVTLVPAGAKEVQVTVNETGAPPEDIRVSLSSIDPQVVTVRGRLDLVQSVATVDLDVNLRTVRDQAVYEGELTARTKDRNVVQVQLSQTRGKATYKVEQVFSQKMLALMPVVTGEPAPGFLVTNIVLDPPSVLVSGPKGVVDGLRTLSIEKVDITGAQRTNSYTRQVEKPPNVTLERQTVVVRVEVQAIDCGGSDRTAACSAATFTVAPAFEGGPPAGLAPENQVSVPVRVSGPLALLSALKPTDIKATISFTGAAAGPGTYPVRVTVPTGLRAEADPVPITLIARPAGTP